MKNKLIHALKNKTVWISIVVGGVAALIYGFVLPPTYLHFINGITFIGFLYLLIGLLRWSWREGDFTFFSWKQKHGSYNKWREGRREERKGASNPFMTSGIIVIIISIILSVLY